MSILTSFAALIVLPALASQDIYSLETWSINGKKSSLAEYKGKPILVVNVASQCGYTPQYEGLQKLHERYKDRGLVVLGVPSNDFGGQEPGTNEEIAKFCKMNFGVTFPLLAKTSVTGSKKHPLYKHLISHTPIDQRGEVKWNFEKFLLSSKGEVVARFDSKVTPDDISLLKSLENSLAKER